MISLEALSEAIFGGPRLSEALLAELFETHRLPIPALVYALPEGESLTARFPKRDLKAAGADLKRWDAIVCLTIHASTVYWFIPAIPLKTEHPGYYLEEKRMLVRAIQQAILRLRQHELAGLRKGGGRADSFTLQQEAQAFYFAVQEVRKESDQAKAALDVWGEIVLHRHQMHLNAIRLKLVELLAALTRGSAANLGYASYSLIKRIYAEHRLSKLGEFPHLIVSEIGHLVAGRHVRPESSPNPAVQKAFAFMEHSFSQPVGLREVAAASHVSPAHLARLFKRETGHTVVDHLHRLRINRARELLATTTLPLIEVAMESGFESQEHFHRLFRRQCGVTPRTYRLNA